MAPTQYRLPDTFKIHYDDIDQEHDVLVAIINDCSRIVCEGSQDALRDRLSTLIDNMHAHFENEEGHMRELGYKGLEWHVAHHREAIAHTEQLVARAERAGGLDQHLLHAIFNDVIKDVAHADLKFREFLEDEGIIDVKR